MTEALSLVLRFTLGLRLYRVEANVQPDNQASTALVHLAGVCRKGFSRRYLKVCGRWHDYERVGRAR